MRFTFAHFWLLMGVVVAGKAIHWFITPDAYRAGTLLRVAVAAQLVAGAVVAIAALRRIRSA